MHSPATLAYFCAPPGHLWEWEEDEEDQAIIWSGDEKCIALRAELDELLPACVPFGLPPLGSVLLIIAAASEWYYAGEIRARLWDAAERASGNREVPEAIASLWKIVGAGLDHIHALPAELRTSVPARQRLLSTLFDHESTRLPSERAQRIIDEFAGTPYLKVFRQRTLEWNGISRLLAYLSELSRAFQHCPPEHLEERLRTGIYEIPTRPLELPLPPPDETPTPEPPADLLRALENEGGELAQVAGLVRRMSAILHVPKAVTQREELPLGGVSDITNRGDPSRLLMTELAWDDLTFAVRLAQGEALYLRRESPPAEPPPRRLILIDTGIFMWGKPRLFALGAALALLRQKRGEQAATSTVFALDDTGFQLITLDSVETVRAQLTRLRPAPHPGHALALLAEDENAPFKPDEEVFLITHPAAQEALCHLPVWQRLAASVPLHTLLVDREGHLSLTRHSLAGARPLAQARVDAEDLFDLPLNKPNPTKPSPAALTNEAGRLPQFYRQNPWPLYHPGPPATQQAFQLGGKGFVGISNTGCVCWWTHRVHVGRVLCPEAPGKNLRGIVVDPDNDDRVLMLFPSSDFSQIHLLVVSLGGHDEARIVTFSGKLYEVSELRLQSGALTLMDHGVMKALSLFDGRLIASASMHDLKGTPWFDGERFHSQKDSHVLPSMMLSTPSASIKPSTKHHRITEIVRVGFGVTGGLLLEKEKGRTYTLEVSNQGTLKWSLLLGARGHFKTLQELAIPERSECPLTQATFPDGRRVIYDPHGFLHVCDSGDDAHELSLLLVKGQTAAWQSKGFYYGEQTLLWDESRGANSVLQSRAKKLFRPCEPSLTKH